MSKSKKESEPESIDIQEMHVMRVMVFNYQDTLLGYVPIAFSGPYTNNSDMMALREVVKSIQQAEQSNGFITLVSAIGDLDISPNSADAAVFSGVMYTPALPDMSVGAFRPSVIAYAQVVSYSENELPLSLSDETPIDMSDS